MCKSPQKLNFTQSLLTARKVQTEKKEYYMLPLALVECGILFPNVGARERSVTRCI